MARLTEVHVGTESIAQFTDVAGPERMLEAERVAEAIRKRLEARVLWNVNSTAIGGGVAEMLRSLLAYGRGAGVDARWLVIEGDEAFFRITKRLHHALHGSAGDGSPLGEAEHAHYQAVLRENAHELLALVQPGDAVILHDPQTAGLAPLLRSSGAQIVWRCHVGTDRVDRHVELGVRFLAPYVEAAPIHVFSREAYLQMGFPSTRAVVIPPSVDIFSPKNEALEPEVVEGILVHIGIVDGPPGGSASTLFERLDGTPGRVERKADLVRLGSPPSLDQPLVVQVSRWDPLKDPEGVLRGFLSALDADLPEVPHLVLAGPNVRGVADDPEAEATLDAVIGALRSYPEGLRRHVTLASLPTEDIDENAAMVNALQRHATVVVQKSVEEGFGLTVTEAMWKRRAVVASAVGGIGEQIDDGVEGLLLRDPRDGPAFCRALVRLLADPGLRERLGAAAEERVRRDFIGLRHLIQFGRLLSGAAHEHDRAA
jgi:trehalose synthase